MPLVDRLRSLRPRRRPPLPDEARALLGLSADERVLAWSTLVGGGWAAATIPGLRALLPTGALLDRPWTDADRVAWDADSRMLAVWWVASRAATPLEVEEQSFLPEVVHERVRASMVASREVVPPVGGPVRVVLRKAADSSLSTQVVPGRGARTKDPQVAALIERARAELREEVGLPPGA